MVVLLTIRIMVKFLKMLQMRSVQPKFQDDRPSYV